MFEAVKALLESDTITSEVADKLNGEINSKLSELRDEAKKYRLEKEDIVRSFNDVKASNDDLKSKVVDIDKQIETARDEGKAELVKQLETERATHAKLSDQISSFEVENKKLRINDAVNSEIAKYKVKSDLVGDAKTVLSGLTRVTDDGIVFGEDGGSVEEGVRAYFDKRGSYLEPVGDTGSGANGGGGSGNTTKPNMGGDRDARLSAIQNMIDKGK